MYRNIYKCTCTSCTTKINYYDKFKCNWTNLKIMFNKGIFVVIR